MSKGAVFVPAVLLDCSPHHPSWANGLCNLTATRRMQAAVTDLHASFAEVTANEFFRWWEAMCEILGSNQLRLGMISHSTFVILWTELSTPCLHLLPLS